MILLGLHEHILELAIGRLKLPCFLFELLERGEAVIKKFVQSFTLVLILGPFILELFELNRSTHYIDSKILVFFLLELIIFLKLSIGVDETCNFNFSILTHPLESCIFPEGIFNLDIDLVDLYLEIVDL
jgi:hypothetical protein